MHTFGPQALPRTQRMAIAHEIAERVKERFHLEVFAIGLYGSLARAHRCDWGSYEYTPRDDRGLHLARGGSNAPKHQWISERKIYVDQVRKPSIDAECAHRPDGVMLRWLLALPLTSWIALLLENIQPHTTWQAKRVVSPDEQLQLAAAQAAEEKKRQARRSSQTQLTASKKPVSTGEATRPTTPAAKHTASLWDQVDWSQVPDTHPLKQAAFEEAEPQAAERRNAERTRSVLSQMASQQATTPLRSAATNEPVSSPEAPTYNWDEGEGTVTDS